MKSSRYAVVIAAAGQSRRFRAQSTNFESALDKKPFVSLKGRAVWLYSAERFARRSDVAQILLVVSPEDVEEVNQRYSGELAFYGVQIIPGGAERFLSVENALKAVAADVDYIAVHDAALFRVRAFRRRYSRDARRRLVETRAVDLRAGRARITRRVVSG